VSSLRNILKQLTKKSVYIFLITSKHVTYNKRR